MKNIFVLGIVIVLLFGIVLSVLCSATLYYPPITYTSMEEFYKNCPSPNQILGKDYYHDFITEKRLAALGEFVYIRVGYNNFGSYKYKLLDKNAESIIFYVQGSDYEVYCDDIQVDYQNWPTLVKIDYPVTNFKIGELVYMYDDEGVLGIIAFELSKSEDGEHYVICQLSSTFSAYMDDVEDKNCLMKRLLDPKTAEKAAQELMARVRGTYVAPTPAWVLPTAICGGAVLLAAAVAIPTVILRRKKRKAAAAADGAEVDADVTAAADVTDAPDEGENAQM